MELRRAKIPYVLLGGMSFYDRKEVRDVLAYLKLLANLRDDVSLLRIINTPARGIGQSTVTRLTQSAVAAGQPIWEQLAESAKGHDLPPATARSLGQFVTLVEGFRQRVAQGRLVDTLRSLIDEIGYRAELSRLYANPDDRDSRWASVEEVVNALGSYCKRAEKPTLTGFLQDTVLTGRDDDQDKDQQLQRNAVAMMTLHAAKGLEFPEVYLVGMEEELLPHKKSIAVAGTAIDEERRLCYVGITRAKRRLTLTMSLARQKWGKSRPTIPSRFLYEITGQTENPHYSALGRKKRRT
jgi:DNA helicase-2/ATP-dependent DNA helicase PcrA